MVGLVLAATLAAVGWSAPVFAQDRKAEAESLFEEGRALMAKKSFVEACPKFAESYRLEPGLGTLLNLASCEEALGKTASAWAHYREALAVAMRANDTKRIKFARDHADMLERKLSRLAVIVPEESRLPGLEVTRDGQSVGAPAWGSAIAVDPGDHVVEAKADGRETFTTRITVGPDADQKTVTIPLLRPGAQANPNGSSSPSPSPTSPSPTPTPTANRADSIEPRVVLGWTAVGAGSLALAGGTIAGVIAISVNDDAKSHCPTDATCDRDGLALTKEANDLALGSTLAIAAGTVLVATGVAILLFWPRASTGPRPATVGFTF